MATDVAFITGAHERAALLEAVLEQTMRAFPARTGLSVKMLLVVDRPVPAVADIVSVWRRHPNIVVYEPDRGVLDPKLGYGCSVVRNQALDRIDSLGWNPAWVSSRDDDWFFGEGYECLGTLLRDEKLWALRGVNLFIWDRHDNVNVKQHHQFVTFGRHKPGWRRELRLTDGESREVAAHVREHPEAEAWLPFFLVDYGFSTQHSRERVYRNSLNGGRVGDHAVDKLLEEPVLQPRALVESVYKGQTREFWRYQMESWPYRY